MSARNAATQLPTQMGKREPQVSMRNDPTGDKKEREMRNFFGTLGEKSGNVATITTVATSIAAALTVTVVVSSLIARVEKLESDLVSLRSDLDHPRVRPLASIPDAWAHPRQ
jgi:hypothetical protein